MVDPLEALGEGLLPNWVGTVSVESGIFGKLKAESSKPLA